MRHAELRELGCERLGCGVCAAQEFGTSLKCVEGGRIEGRRAALGGEKNLCDIAGAEALCRTSDAADRIAQVPPESVAGGGVGRSTTVVHEAPQVFCLAHHFEPESFGGSGGWMRSGLDAVGVTREQRGDRDHVLLVHRARVERGGGVAELAECDAVRWGRTAISHRVASFEQDACGGPEEPSALRRGGLMAEFNRLGCGVDGVHDLGQRREIIQRGHTAQGAHLVHHLGEMDKADGVLGVLQKPRRGLRRGGREVLGGGADGSGAWALGGDSLEFGHPLRRARILRGSPRANGAQQDLDVVNRRDCDAADLGVPRQVAIADPAGEPLESLGDVRDARNLGHCRATAESAEGAAKGDRIWGTRGRARHERVEFVDVLSGFEDEEINQTAGHCVPAPWALNRCALRFALRTIGVNGDGPGPSPRASPRRRSVTPQRGRG